MLSKLSTGLFTFVLACAVGFAVTYGYLAWGFAPGLCMGIGGGCLLARRLGWI